jgi:farnesyl-diphosphate farnesyltransferase
MSQDAAPLLTDVLQQVSRSFYKTLWILPRSVRRPISLAYLLARATDTIADTEMLPVKLRLDALRHFRERIAGAHRQPLDFGALAAQQGTPGERVLLERAEEALALLEAFPEEDQDRIREVLRTITSGQELDLQRFGGAAAESIVALQSDTELDDYTYRVAGCVGEFWTKMCEAHVYHAMELDVLMLSTPHFDHLSVRFGKGLQLVNILRDLPVDLRKGRCYLPEDKLRAAGLAPADLLKPENEPRLRPLYDTYLDTARAHLEAGWEYTNLVPGSPRVRLACAWPILIGVRTLALLRTGNVLDPARRIKVSRAEVKRIILRSVAGLVVRPMWRGLFARASVPAVSDCGGKRTATLL